MTGEEAAERVCAVLREITAGGLEVCTDWDDSVLTIYDGRGPRGRRAIISAVNEQAVDFMVTSYQP